MPSSSQPQQPPPSPPPHPYMRVVLVEDDPSLRDVLARYCRSIGMDVLAEFGDGQAALEQLSQDGGNENDDHSIDPRPDLILTDCQMPRLDGIALARRLRARGDRTPIIMLSGQQDARVADLALAAGVNCFLPKPLSPQRLHDALARTFPGWAA